MVLEDYAMVRVNIWAIGSHFEACGCVFHSSDNGDSWGLQWEKPEKLFGGLCPSLSISQVN